MPHHITHTQEVGIKELPQGLIVELIILIDVLFPII